MIKKKRNGRTFRLIIIKNFGLKFKGGIGKIKKETWDMAKVLRHRLDLVL